VRIGTPVAAALLLVLAAPHGAGPGDALARHPEITRPGWVQLRIARPSRLPPGEELAWRDNVYLLVEALRDLEHPRLRRQERRALERQVREAWDRLVAIRRAATAPGGP
jgi:hypothetical protein